jgi:hypothetical protein
LIRKPRLRTSIATGSVALLGIVSSVGSTSRVQHPEVGIGLHLLDPVSIARVQDLGVRRIRYTLYWSLWQNVEYRREWERDIHRALQAGLDPLVVVHQAPFGGFQQRREVYREFAGFMAERAREFPGIRAWQLWNEMDVTFTDVFGAGRPEVSLRQRGHLYAEMLRLAYPAIKRANPKAVVVVGGIASAVESGFLQGLYDEHAMYDVLAIHTYGFPLVLPFQERGLATRRLMRSHRDTRPLWNTEFGLERAVIPDHQQLTPAQTDSVQLAAWSSVVQANARNRYYDRIYGYVLAEGTDLGFGLVRLDGSARPVYRWLKTWARHQ